MLRRPRFWLLAALGGGLGFAVASCGADSKNSPTEAQAQAQRPQACESLSELAPALWDAVQTDQVAGLREVLNQLNAPSPGGNTPYLDQVLQALFVALNEFAQDPPEAGNTDGLCNPTDQLPLNQTNRLCDLRRLLKIYVHEGSAKQSLYALDPLLGGVFSYMIGVPPGATSPHYEIARDLESMCTPTGVCDVHDTFDLLQGVTSFLTPDRSQQLLTDVSALANDPSLNGIFATLAGGTVDGGADTSAEYGFELITNELLYAVLSIDLTTPSGRANYFQEFDHLLNGDGTAPGLYSLLPATDAGAQLAAEIGAAAGDLKIMLDPNLSEPIFQPLQKALTCATQYELGSSLDDRTLRPGLIQMIFHLGFEAKVLTLTQLLAALNQLAQIDAHSAQPGLLVYVLHDIIAALNADPQAGGALTQLCHVLFATERACTDGTMAPCPPLPLNYQLPTDGGLPLTAGSPLANACSSGLAPAYPLPDVTCESNVEAAVPEINTLFNQGVVDQILCVIDTLVYGCAGGDQPSCEAPAPFATDAGS